MTIGKIVHKLARCASTNDAARSFADDGFEEGMVVLADEQTAGRGTKGRSWFSPPGQGLYLSVILRPDRRAVPLIPLVAGLAAREAVASSTGLEAGLEWPNDIIWRGRKLGGILCESSWSGSHFNYVILGMGLNVGQRRKDFPDELRQTAVSLRLALGRPSDREALLAALYPALGRWYDVLGRGGGDRICRAAERAMGLRRGARVSLETPAGPESGTFLGFRPDGSLGLRRGGREAVFPPSEVLAVHRS